MTLKFTLDWCAAGNDPPELFHTMARLSLRVGDANLMKNEDIWSRTVQNSVLISAYPLAIWLASSWWRLNWEPLPPNRPSLDWRMTHELGAANYGFVWPRILFASDCESIKVWAASSEDSGQSVRYISGLDRSLSVPLTDFQHGTVEFINTVLSRLHALSLQNTDLSELWRKIQVEGADPVTAQYRQLEAQMGYDPDECPESLMNQVLSQARRVGTKTLSELAPVYGKSARQSLFTAIQEIADSPGLVGAPTAQALPDSFPATQREPWKRAVVAAERLRQHLGNLSNRIDNSELCDLLGIKAADFEQWSPGKRKPAAVAVCESDRRFRFISRKKHPAAKRFELARFLGDYLLTAPQDGQWLTSTDLSTSRQKYQRAFAAEFLCPITALRDFLQEDFSEGAIEDAADHFQVSQTTVNSLLLNNGLMPSCFIGDYADAGFPYPRDV